MKRKIIVLILACLLLTVFSACGVQVDGSNTADAGSNTNNGQTNTETADAVKTKADAFNIYNNSLKAMSIDGGFNEAIDMDMLIDMKMSYGGESMDIPIAANIKTITAGDEIQMSMYMDMGDLGGIMEIYTDGKRAYYAVNGIGEVVDISTVDDLMNQDMFEMPEFSLDAITDFTIEKQGSDTKTTMILNGEALSGFTSQIMESMLPAMGDVEFSFDISDVTISIVTDNKDNLKAMNMNLDFTIEAEGESISLSASYDFIVNATGDDVKVDLSKLEGAAA